MRHVATTYGPASAGSASLRVGGADAPRHGGARRGSRFTRRHWLTRLTRRLWPRAVVAPLPPPSGAPPPPLVLYRFVYTSFGGLLMQLSGEPKVLPARSFAVDKRVYLFIRKVAAE